MALPTTQPKTSPQNAAAKPNPAQLRAMTEKLAYEIWERSGKKHGRDQENWYEAEKLARQKLGL